MTFGPPVLISKIKRKTFLSITCHIWLYDLVSNIFQQNVSTVNLPTIRTEAVEVSMVSEEKGLEAAKEDGKTVVPGLDKLSN